MRARNLKPGLFKNEVLGTADPLLTLLFEGLWCLADRDGRLEDRPLRIKAEIFPYRELDINGELTVLSRLGFIQRYEAQVLGDPARTVKVIEVLNFKKHQNPHHTEKKSELPAPASSPLNNGETPADSLIPDSLIPDKTSLSELKTSSDLATSGPNEKNLKPSKEASKLAQLLKADILRNKPDYRITPTQERKWAETADRMIRIDRRAPEQIAELIRWAQRDEFWMTNILSMEKLRGKFDELQLKAAKSSTRQPGNGKLSTSPVSEMDDFERARKQARAEGRLQ